MPARLTTGPLPPYRFLPGRTPHPRRDPRGHGYGRPEPPHTIVDPARWASCDVYLWGVDLFNHELWWESHEAFEALWHGAGAGATPAAAFFQGLIQVAAAELKRVMGNERAAQSLYARGLARLAGVPSPFLGADVAALVADVRDRKEGARDVPARIVLAR